MMDDVDMCATPDSPRAAVRAARAEAAAAVRERERES
jgi:hypothetical protein